MIISRIDKNKFRYIIYSPKFYLRNEIYDFMKNHNIEIKDLTNMTNFGEFFRWNFDIFDNNSEILFKLKYGEYFSKKKINELLF